MNEKRFAIRLETTEMSENTLQERTFLPLPPIQEPDFWSMSKRELHLIQHLRSLGPARYAIYVTKTGPGPDGLHSWMIEKLPAPEGD